MKTTTKRAGKTGGKKHKGLLPKLGDRHIEALIAIAKIRYAKG